MHTALRHTAVLVSPRPTSPRPAASHRLTMLASAVASLGFPLAVGASVMLANVAGGGDSTTGLVTSGGAVVVLGGVLSWILTKTDPANRELQRQTIEKLTTTFAAEMTAQRESHRRQMNATRKAFSREMSLQRESQDRTNERLLRWLSQRADLPGYPPDDAGHPPAKPKP